ncbi:EAL domain-containing protein [Magnetococcus sp. PR-3]|uniref:EAL domain-containing protein n=1 Tax=Magnetococcus sp. PR-3 TaxID=3120355 RepID=UPI002FCDEF59
MATDALVTLRQKITDLLATAPTDAHEQQQILALLDKMAPPQAHTPHDYHEQLFLYNPVSQLLLDETGLICDCNETFAKTMGHTRQDLLGQALQVLIYGEDQPLYQQNYVTFFSKPAEHPLTLRFNGTHQERPLTMEFRASERLPGQTFKRIIALHDTTAHTELEQELALSNLFLDAIVEAIPTMVFIKEAKDLRFARFNKAGEALLGISRQEMIGKNDYDFFPPQEADFFVQKDRHVLDSGETLEIPEEAIQTRNGPRYLHTFKSVIHDSDGTPTHLLGVSLDITPRKALEKELESANDQLMQINETLEQRIQNRTQQLEKTNQQLQRQIEQRQRMQDHLQLSHEVIRNTSEGVMITDTHGTILEVNEAFCQITGYARDEVLGQNPAMMKSDRHDASFFTQMWKAITSDGYWSGEVWDRRKNGEVFPKWLTINSVHNEAGVLTRFVSIFSDISQRKADEAALEKLARFDPLTDLPNRTLFQDRLQHQMTLAKRTGEHFTLMFLDLDHFKDINDTMGHVVGDRLLQEVALRLSDCLREEDTIARGEYQMGSHATISRMGGDEFTIILVDCQDNDAAVEVAQRTLEALRAPFYFEGYEVFIQSSIGLALYPQDGTEAEILLKNADSALHQAKADGRGGFRFFTSEMNHKAQRRMALESRMRSALDKGQFQLYYQPKVCGQHGTLLGMEALIRWQDPEHGLISPGDFIPLAEDVGLILPMSDWILKQACQETIKLIQQGWTEIRVAVNLSAKQFNNPKQLIEAIQTALDEAQLDPKHLELEITESMVMGNVQDAVKTIHQLRAMGLSIAMDDFGTGYSSLAYLKQLPIQTLKIDRSFVIHLEKEQSDKAIVSTVLAMAEHLNLNVVAEGVETQAQADFLSEQGCKELQGYYFSRPQPLEQLIEQLQEPRWSTAPGTLR